MTYSRFRLLLVSIFGTPWLYLVMFLTLVFVAADLGSIDQGRSGLISIARGENGRWLTCGWFLATLSVVTLPFFVLWQERAITRIERSGFLPLLLTSRLPERRYRAGRLTTSLIGVLVVAILTAVIGALTLSGLKLPEGGAGNFLLAGLVIHIPNLLLGAMLAAFLTRMEERAVALGIGIATPLALIMFVGLTSDYVPDGVMRLFHVSIEPTGTLFFAELHRSSTDVGWGDPAATALLPLVLNRLLVVVAAGWLGRKYLNAPSVFEQRPRKHRPKRPVLRRLSPFTISFALALIAALMAVSNVHSNFSKNLTLYEIDPSMGFLFAAALGEIHVYLVVAMMLLVGKLAWDSRETGFDVLEISGRTSGLLVTSRAALHLAVAVGTFVIVVIAGVGAMFAGHWEAFSLAALAEYALIRWVPGFLLLASVFYLLTLIAPNRVAGYLITITCVIGYLFARQKGALDLPVSAFAPSPSWSTLGQRVSWEISDVTGAVARVGLGLSFFAIAVTLAGRWRRIEASWVSRRTRRSTLAVAGFALVLIIVPVVATDLIGPDAKPFPATAEMSAAYENAAAAIHEPSAWRTVAVDHRLHEEQDGTTILESTLSIVQLNRGESRIPITWGVRREQVESIRVNDHDAPFTLRAPGLFLIDDQEGNVELNLRARVARTSRDAVSVDSFHGFWPTMPVVGVLPELFLRSAESRRRLGLPEEVPPVEIFHDDGLSRLPVHASIAVEQPCERNAAIPYAPFRQKLRGRCAGNTARPAVRNELFAGSGLWQKLEGTGENGRISLLFPSHQADVARLFLQDSMVAKEAVAEALQRYEPLDLTLVSGGAPQIGSSSALSKPGTILISDVAVLDTALRREERRRRFVTLMAHEIAHQWFGPARTGIPGAIFVNEVPAELVRGYVALRIFGEEGYRLYLGDVTARMYYELRTQRVPDGAPLDTSESDEIYYRAAVLGAFVADRIGWSGLLDNLAVMASEASAGNPSTSRDVALRLLRGLEGEDLDFARLLIETDMTFEWRGDGLSSSCQEDCPPAPPRFPVRTGGAITWLPIDEVGTEDLDRSPLGALVIGNRRRAGV